MVSIRFLLTSKQTRKHLLEENKFRNVEGLLLNNNSAYVTVIPVQRGHQENYRNFNNQCYVMYNKQIKKKHRKKKKENPTIWYKNDGVISSSRQILSSTVTSLSIANKRFSSTFERA